MPARQWRSGGHFCDVTLTAKKPISEAYPKTLETIGDHLRKKRLDLKLFQKNVANAIGVDTLTVCNWEKNRVGPALRFIPKIIEFFGYDPFQIVAFTLGQWIMRYRRRKGLSIKKLAWQSGIDTNTLARWEKGDAEQRRKHRKRKNSLLKILAG